MKDTDLLNKVMDAKHALKEVSDALQVRCKFLNELIDGIESRSGVPGQSRAEGFQLCLQMFKAHGEGMAQQILELDRMDSKLLDIDC